MKKYPKVDGKPIDKYSIARMDKYEQVIKYYLDMDGGKYTNDILAFNIAFLLLEV